MGLVTGPHARSPGTHSQWVVGLGRTPERRSSREPRHPPQRAGSRGRGSA